MERLNAVWNLGMVTFFQGTKTFVIETLHAFIGVQTVAMLFGIVIYTDKLRLKEVSRFAGSITAILTALLTFSQT